MKKYILLFLVFSNILALGQEKKLPELTLKTQNISSVAENNKNNTPKEDKYSVNFKLCGNGSFTRPDFLKDYIVIEYEGLTKQQLYINILSSISQLYNSPNDVISKIENESITVDGYYESISHRDVPIGDGTISVTYKIQFLFKDGKIRVNSPIIKDVWETTLSKFKLNNFNEYVKNTLWNKYPKTVYEIQSNMNKTINCILKNAVNKEDW